MDDTRTLKIEMIRAAIERQEYVVDPHKVAEAIVAKLLAGREAKK